MSNYILSYLSKYKKQHKKRQHRVKNIIFPVKHENFTYYINKRHLDFRFTYIFYVKHQFILSKSFIFYFRKFLKKFLKKKRIKIYYYAPLNLLLSKKHKNSRMGKGVGSFTRYAAIKKTNSIFFIVKNMDLQRSRIFIKIIKKRIRGDFFIYQIFSKSKLI